MSAHLEPRGRKFGLNFSLRVSLDVYMTLDNDVIWEAGLNTLQFGDFFGKVVTSAGQVELGTEGRDRSV